MNTFGENLRSLRKSRGYSQEKFAFVIGSTQAAVTAWERSERMPNVAMIRHIADTFKVPLSSLLPINETGHEEDFVSEVAEAMHKNPKIRILFDKTRRMSSKDLDVIISVVDAISSEREESDD